MSIENTLERIAAALEAIERKLNANEAAPEKPKPARSAAKPKAETTSSTADTSAETPSSAGSPASDTDDIPSALGYEAHVKPLILKIGAQKGRDAILALLGEYGVKSGQELTSDQYVAFVASANEVLG